MLRAYDDNWTEQFEGSVLTECNILDNIHKNKLIQMVY